MTTERGQRVTVVDAFGRELPKIALGSPELGEDFAVIWVSRPEEWEAAQREGREPDAVPWPIEDVTVLEPVA
ncbi:MAG: hypothetical protein LC749_14595 [Actinobacteria bacterium]|nr:hypothetical protein [Actinomycetota bacterium]